MKKILFQGDSITESGRAKDEKWSEKYQGSGYPVMVAAELGYKYPDKYTFINRGISGNSVVDILARVKTDIIKIKPDVLSILVGVNDVWRELKNNSGFSEKSFERIYDVLLYEIKENLPGAKIIIMEPFLLKGEDTLEHWDKFRSEVEKRAVVAKKLAEKYGADFIPLQARFDEMYEKASMGYWLFDGVHPTSAGHKIIADAWLQNFKKYENK